MFEALLTPSPDLEHVAGYDAQGATLAQAVLNDHGPSLRHTIHTAMFAPCAALIAMEYISADDIAWPPHESLPTRDRIDLGSEPEVVIVLGVLLQAQQFCMCTIIETEM